MNLNKNISIEVVFYFLISILFFIIFKESISSDEIIISHRYIISIVSYNTHPNSFLFAGIVSFLFSIYFLYKFFKSLKQFFKQKDSKKFIIILILTSPLWGLMLSTLLVFLKIS